MRLIYTCLFISYKNILEQRYISTIKIKDEYINNLIVYCCYIGTMFDAPT